MRIFLLCWLVIINLAAIAATASDKFTAAHKHTGSRVPERTLLALSALGGSVTMYLTMLLIRHKTRKPKFMVGIPVIIILQAAAVFALWRLGVRI